MTIKAKDLSKKGISIEQLEGIIKEADSKGENRFFLYPAVLFTDEVKMKLIENGFKVYKGDWDGIMKDVFIIEW